MKTVHKKTVQKYFNFLVELKSMCETKKDFSIVSLSNSYSVSTAACTAAKKLRIIENTGTQYKPTYKWRQGDPTPIMARKLLEGANEYLRTCKANMDKELELKYKKAAKLIVSDTPVKFTPYQPKPQRKQQPQVGLIRQFFRWIYFIIPFVKI
jgi:hypothetical protein